MTTLLLTLLLFVQGIPVQPQQGGTITGTLRDVLGKPAGGIRVTAVARPESIDQLIGDASALSSLDQTDEQGRYTLQNVPPGRYLVSAGILNFPTYYPGTQSIAEGKVIAVAPGQTVSGIDFTLKDSSSARVIGANGFGGGTGGFSIPVDFTTDEKSVRVPIFGNGKTTGVRAEPVAGGAAVTASVTQAYLPLQPIAADYRVTVEGLPPGYSVKSMLYGATDVSNGIVKITNGVPASATALTLAPNAFGTTTVNIFGGGVISYVNGVAPGALIAPVPQTLRIVLSRAPRRSTAGVTVTGQFNPAIRGAFLSGNSATIYLDYTYEFSSVPPGRHTLTAFSNSKSVYVASLIVRDQDINGVALEETAALPLDARTPTPPGPVGNRPAGPLPLAAVRGKLLDGETGDPLTLGDVFLVGDYWVGQPLNAEGTFEFGKLLPGRYQIEVKAVGYPTFQREFTINEKDVELEFKSN